MVSFILLLIGALAKIEHWWWASYGLILGIFCLALSILMSASKRHRHWTSKIAIASTILILLGMLAKLEHFWYASYLIILGLVITCLCYTIRFGFKPKKNIYDLSKLLLIWSVVIGYYMSLEHWRISFEISIVQSLILILFVALSFVDIIKKRIFTTV